MNIYPAIKVVQSPESIKNKDTIAKNEDPAQNYMLIQETNRLATKLNLDIPIVPSSVVEF